MSEETIAAFPVVASRPSRHRFGEPLTIRINSADDRRAQTERTCALCGAVKITVHGLSGSYWREWRERGELVARAREIEPTCTGAADE